MDQNNSSRAVPDDLFLTRVMDAPRELVWKAYSEAEALAQWWGPKGCGTRVEKLDFRPGGIFHYAMQTPQGGEMWGKFVYWEIQPPERIVFVLSFSDPEGNTVRAPFSDTHPLEVYSEVTFTEEGGKTRITMRGGPLNATEAERASYAALMKNMQIGTNATLDKLAAYLAEKQA
jgi:uncharacterized protein YndB with AHSA1/START domain